MAGELEPLLQSATLIGGAAGILQVGDAIAARRSRRLRAYVDEVTGQTGLRIEELTARLESDDFVSEVFERGAEAAARTSAESKRWHLAKIAAAAVSGEGLATPDELQVMLRTVEALEPGEVQLLALIGTLRPGKGQLAGTLGEMSASYDDLAYLWPEAVEMFDPYTAALNREGLLRVEERTYATSAGDVRAWRLSPYGHRFLAFLQGGPYEVPDLAISHLRVRIEQDGFGPVIRNLGLGTARDIVVRHFDVDADGSILREPIEYLAGVLGPDETHHLDITHPSLGSEARLHVELTWSDERGDQSTAFTWDQIARSPDIRFPHGRI